jgi:phytoene dehydrogenase-like protein
MNAPVVVIGAGVNELVCAHCLARAGRKVLLLDEYPAAPEAWRLDAGWVPQAIVRDLALDAQGLALHHPDPWLTAPLPAGGRLELSRDLERSAAAIGRLSPGDAAKWPQFCERLARLARLLQRLYAAPLPDLSGREPGDLAQLARLAFGARALGRRAMEDLLRLVSMPVADFLDDIFACDVLKGALGAAGVMHLAQGPRAGGTALRLLHHHVGSPPGVFRPPLSNVGEVMRRLPGVEVRAGAKVAAIVARAARATGVVLAGGEEIPAALVVSGADPRRTLLELGDPGWLDPEFVRTVRRIRRRGVSARVTLALDRAPGFSTFAVAPSLDYLERAHDDAKYGHVSRAPYLEARNAGRSADGRHRVEVHFQYAPYVLAGGAWSGDERRALGDLAAKVLSRHVPELEGAAAESVLTPCDLEERYGWPEGQLEHAEPALDQFFWMRPAAELAHYRTPIAGLYLCGPAMHPGGGVPGACGYNAARVILRDLRRY